MSTQPKQGPATKEELLALWRSVVDPDYAAPMVEAGDGSGLEAYNQAFSQFARVSQAIDRSTQAMYISPWSGQTAAPAGGAALATVTLTISRAGFPSIPLVLMANVTGVEESVIAAGDGGGVAVLPGREFTFSSDVVFDAGDTTSKQVVATALHPGYGFNNPMPGSLSSWVQPGSGYSHVRASVQANGFAGADAGGAGFIRMVAANEPDVPLPQHVGQYVQFTAGSNAGRTFRIVGYISPTLNDGGSFDLALDGTLSAAIVAVGQFAVGETVTFSSGGIQGVGVVLKQTPPSAAPAAVVTITYRLKSGVVPAGATIAGLSSGSTATLGFNGFVPAVTAETGTAEWRILDLAGDWLATSTNVAAPSGGLLGTLDALGGERDIPRAAGEGDLSYHRRVSQIADVVSPAAIRRALFRTLGTTGWAFCEVGQASWPGFYFDAQDAYDTRVVVANGAAPPPAFADSEPVRLINSKNDVIGLGYFGAAVGNTAICVFKDGPWKTNVAGGMTLIGLKTGSAYAVTSTTINESYQAFRKRALLDYTDMRATMIIEIAPQSAGEFGFAYDVTTMQNAYDAPIAIGNYFDGFPYLWARQNLTAYAAVQKTRAGGVGVHFVLPEQTQLAPP